MKLEVLAVRDRSAQFFFPPFFVRTNVEGLRMFQKLMEDPARTGAKSEYDLHQIGEFDDQTGAITPVMNIPVLANGADFGGPTTNGHT